MLPPTAIFRDDGNCKNQKSWLSDQIHLQRIHRQVPLSRKKHPAFTQNRLQGSLQKNLPDALRQRRRFPVRPHESLPERQRQRVPRQRAQQDFVEVHPDDSKGNQGMDLPKEIPKIKTRGDCCPEILESQRLPLKISDNAQWLPTASS